MLVSLFDIQYIESINLCQHEIWNEAEQNDEAGSTGVLSGRSVPLIPNFMLTQIILMSIYCISNNETNMKFLLSSLVSFLDSSFRLRTERFLHFIPSSPPPERPPVSSGLFILPLSGPYSAPNHSAILLLVNRYVPSR